MACRNCASGGGCGTGSGLPAGCKNNGACGTGGCNNLTVFDWLAGMELPDGKRAFDVVEIRFKSTRKDFYQLSPGLEVHVGDAVAVEAMSGHDVGVISLTGELVRMQMQKRGVEPNSRELRKVYRKVRDTDIEKWREAQDLEQPTMLRARKMALDLGLDMKISDVEYQGDRTKATFFYTADDRVDFRDLIRLMAEEFQIRIDMRQIGARQEAGRLGGIGSCGRELCCSTWLTDFRSVSTSAARYQQLSINPMKLAGQCGKLKCCLNYELDGYMEAIRTFPKSDVKLQTKKGLAFQQKTDIFKSLVWYSYVDEPNAFIPLPLNRVLEIIEMNKEGIKPDDLRNFAEVIEVAEPDYENVVGQDDLTRFDRKRSSRGGKGRGKGKTGGEGGKSSRGRGGKGRGNAEARTASPAGDKPAGENKSRSRGGRNRGKGQGQSSDKAAAPRASGENAGNAENRAKGNRSGGNSRRRGRKPQGDGNKPKPEGSPS